MFKTIVFATIAGVLFGAGCAQVPEIQDLPQFDFVIAINDDNVILGFVGSRVFAGLADGIPEPVDGGLGLSTLGASMNRKGQVAGVYHDDNLDQQVFVFDPDTGLIDLAAPGTSASAVAINDLGQVFWISRDRVSGEKRLYLRENDGSIQSIPLAEGGPTEANNVGQLLIGHPTRPSVLTVSDSEMLIEQIENPNNLQLALYDINNHGQVVGRAVSPNRAVTWTADEGLRDLLGPGEAEGFTSIAMSINDAGLVALTLIPSTGFYNAEFAFHSPERGLIRFPHPEIPVPAACAPGTFRISSHAGPGSVPPRSKTLNESGLAWVQIVLDCLVGDYAPIISLPATATIDKGIQLLPLPRGLDIEDLFVETDYYGRTINIYERARFLHPDINNNGKMTANFETYNTFLGIYPITTHLYNLRRMVYSASELLTELSELVATLPAEDFLDDQRQQALLEKIDVIRENVEADDLASLCDAIGQLQHDILPKTDGESPPEDWVTDTSAQEDMEALVVDIIAVLQRQADELGGCP